MSRDLAKTTAGLSPAWAGFLLDWDRSLRSANYPQTTRYNYLLAAAQLARYLAELAHDANAVDAARTPTARSTPTVSCPPRSAPSWPGMRGPPTCYSWPSGRPRPDAAAPTKMLDDRAVLDCVVRTSASKVRVVKPASVSAGCKAESWTRQA